MYLAVDAHTLVAPDDITRELCEEHRPDRHQFVLARQIEPGPRQHMVPTTDV